MPEEQRIRIGDILRYSSVLDPGLRLKDGLLNFNHITRSNYPKRSLLERGINPIAPVRLLDGTDRRPAVLIRSSTHRIGSDITPWQDSFDPDNGRIVYFGDNKRAGEAPESSPGNRLLLQIFSAHESNDIEVRRAAAPLLFFKGVPHDGRAKGQVVFQGYGIISGVTLVTQYHARRAETFSNYRFECVVFDLAKEAEEFDWVWINTRRDPHISDEQAVHAAPKAWRLWVQHGAAAVERCRRRVAKLLVVDKAHQQPPTGSREERVLNTISRYYEGRKHRFEVLAAETVGHILARTGSTYLPGWITPPAGDGGADFVGRLDVGSGFSQVKIVVLGQAKCENPAVPTSGRDIARTVARLRRGWIGAYVTTSFFSRRVQEEVFEDQYPILLVNGYRLASEVMAMAHEEGYINVESYLEALDSTYPSAVGGRKPEEILTL